MREGAIFYLWQNASVIVRDKPIWTANYASVVIYVEVRQTINTNLGALWEANLAIRNFSVTKSHA